MRLSPTALALLMVPATALMSVAEAQAGGAMAAPQGVNVPLLFFPNEGQLADGVEFAGRAGGLATFFANDGFTVRLTETAQRILGESSYRGVALRYTFEGANPAAEMVGEEPNAARFNFYKGQDPSRWRSGVESFGAVRYRGIYEGVDVVVRDASGTLEYDLVVAPGASLDQVRIRCEGADSLALAEDGSLVATTRFGELTQRFPRTWQVDASGERRAVDSRFVLLGDDTYGFVAPDRDPSRGAVVDPGLTYSSLLGGSETEHGCGVSVDQLCGLYIAGDTNSLDFPTDPGAFDETFNGDVDTFVTRVDAIGKFLIYSTYIGGSLGDFGHGVIVDTEGYAYVTGGTKSVDYPTTLGSFDPTPNGQGDIFVTKLSPNGQALTWSTFIGGTGEEGSLGGQGIAIDANKNVYVAAFTSSTDFPITAGALDSTFNGVSDVTISKLSADGSALLYSTFLGGTDLDIANAIDVDANGNAFIAGWAISADYPRTAGAFGNTPNGNSNGIVSKVDANGQVLSYSTFTGGSSEVVRGVAVLGDDAFVTGYTLSTVLPVTAGAFDTTANGNGDGFVFRFNQNGTGVHYGAYLGGTELDGGNAIDTDPLGGAYVTGWTESANFPTTVTAFDTSYNGNQDAYVTRISPDGSTIDYSSFLGGSAYDVAFAINVHDVGSVYLAGGTFSADFPTTLGALDTTINGKEDLFMVLLPAGPQACPAAAAMATYGASEMDSLGNLPTLNALSLPKVPSFALNIQVANARPNASVIMLLGASPVALPFDGGTLLVAPSFILGVGATDAAGQLLLSTGVNENPNFCGSSVYMQAAIADRSSPSLYKVTLTNGLQLTFGF
jgi:hypothetical protein